MAQAYLGTTELNKLYLGTTQINDVEVGKYPISGLVAAYVPGATNGRSGSIIFDLSGNGNDLTISGSFSFTSGYIALNSSGSISSTSSYSSLTGTDPVFTSLYFLRPPGAVAYNHLWYLGPTSYASNTAIFDANPNFPTFVTNKIIAWNGFVSGVDNVVFTALQDSTNLAGDLIAYSSGSFTMWAIKRDVTAVFTGSTWNATYYVKNYRKSGIDVNGNYISNTLGEFGDTGSYIDSNAVNRALTVDWSSSSPRLFIAGNPLQSNSIKMDFAAAFLYDRVLTNDEIESIYSYVNSITPLT